VILSGGPASVTEDDTPRAPQAVFELGVPVLGICYGMQTMAEQLGGKVENGQSPRIRLRRSARPWPFETADRHPGSRRPGRQVLAGCLDEPRRPVVDLPPGFKVICDNASTPVAGMADDARQFYGVQFHPEVTHTLQGKAILGRFVHDICGCGQDWNMPTTSTRPSPRFVPKSVPMKSSSACPAGSIPRWRLR
jgi:GMP synthase (glutamine-hydrolysing)